MTLKDKIENKNIIFFSVQTFNLEKEIILKLKQFGANVHYFDERPSNSNFTKGIIRLKRSFYQHKIDSYYKKILKNSREIKYDYLFVNRGEVIPAFFLKDFKTAHPRCEFIFFTWDSFTNHNHPTTILEYFDKKFTFDPDDAKKYKIDFRPLFYLDSYKNMASYDGNILYDLLFLGTAHSDRYRIGNFLAELCKKNGLNTFTFYYMHGRIVYFYKRFFEKSFKEFDFKKLAFKSLTTSEILSLYEKSNVILDINHPGQKGLTMRTFEAIGANKKLITTNSEIIKYPFYNKNNVFLIDRNDLEIDFDFFKNTYEPLPADIMFQISIDGWLYSLFVDHDNYFWINT